MPDHPIGDPEPAFEDREAADKAHEILRRPSNVPMGHTDLSEARPAHKEDITNPRGALSPNMVWILPGLAYCMVGIDKSLFELYSNHADKVVKVTTHRSETPLFHFDGVDTTRNAWFYTIQGVEDEIGASFCDFVQSFLFNDQPKGLQWRITMRNARIADPFAKGKRRIGINTVLFLPECITTKRRVTVIQEPGLTLDKLVLGVGVPPIEV